VVWSGGVIVSARDIARRYAEARRFRRDMLTAGWFGTGYALRGYIAALRRQWAYVRRTEP
jgi:hypothetical protein